MNSKIRLLTLTVAIIMMSVLSSSLVIGILKVHSATSGFNMTTDKTIYNLRPGERERNITFTNFNSTITGQHNISVVLNITPGAYVASAYTPGFSFEIMNATDGTYRVPSQSADNVYAFPDINFTASMFVLRFNLSSNMSFLGDYPRFNITVIIYNSDGSINATISQNQTFNLGGINISNVSNGAYGGFNGTIVNESMFFRFIISNGLNNYVNCSAYVDGVGNYTKYDVVGGEAAIGNVSVATAGSHTVQMICGSPDNDNISSDSVYFISDLDSPFVGNVTSLGASFTNDSSLSGGALSFSVTGNDTVAFQNLSVYLDGLLVNSTSSSGMANYSLRGINTGNHSMTFLAYDYVGRKTNLTISSFTYTHSEDIGSRMKELNVSLNLNSTNAIGMLYANGTLAAGSIDVNNLFNLSLWVNATTDGDVFVNVTVPLNGTLVNWDRTSSPSLETSNVSISAQTLGNITGTSVRYIAHFQSLNSFINVSSYNTVVMTFNTTLGASNVFYVDNDTVNVSTIFRLSNCSGTNTNPTSAITSTSQACYVVGPGNVTVYVPHLSGVAIAADSLAPSFVFVTPTSGQAINDSLLTLSFIVNETNPNATSAFCNYSISNISNSTPIGIATNLVGLSSFTYLTNYSMRYTVNVTSLTGLSTGTNYSLNLTCQDALGNTGLSSVNFSINDSTWPQIHTVSESVSTDTITVSWQTGELSNASLNISGKTPDSSTTFTQTHSSFDVAGLSEGTAYTYTMRSCDRAGNCAMEDGSATTSSSSSSSSSSGGSSGGSSSTTTTAPTTKSQAWSSLSTGTATVLPGSSAIAITEMDIIVKQAMSNAQITISNIGSSSIAGVASPAGFKIFQFIDIVTVNMPAERINGSKMKFIVDKAWLTANSVQDANVYLLRYVNNAWVQLPTQVLYISETSTTYQADTPGFSYFAVAGKATTSTAPPPAGNATTTPPPTETGADDASGDTQVPSADTAPPPPAPVKPKGGIGATQFLWIGAIVVVAALIGGYFIFTKKTVNKPKL